MTKPSHLLFGLVLVWACAVAQCACGQEKEIEFDPVPVTDVPGILPKPSLPGLLLADEKSEILWQQPVKDASGRRTEERTAFRDGTQAHTFFSAKGAPTKYTLYKGAVLVAEGAYDEAGRRIVVRKNFRDDGSLESTWKARPDGEEWKFFDAKGTLLREVYINSEGVERRTDFEGGLVPVKSSVDVGAVHNVSYQVDLTHKFEVRLVGRRVDQWQLVDNFGHVDHIGKYLPNGDLEFVVFDERGLVTRTQRWQFIGEDWNRPYYRLANMTGLWEDGRTKKWSVDLYANGLLKNISMFHKNGALDTARSFDTEGLTIDVNNFEPDGKLKNAHKYEENQRPRGFTPTGLREIPGQKYGKLYDFGGLPFKSGARSGTQHPLFLFVK